MAREVRYMNGVSRTTMVYLFNILTVYRIDASFSESRSRPIRPGDFTSEISPRQDRTGLMLNSWTRLIYFVSRVCGYVRVNKPIACRISRMCINVQL